jgi:6-pyruvoyltetrahydropterin/6-carboxytetrahydropterin synthase
MVMNLSDLKETMNECIMKPLDHKNIDKDVLHFTTTPSTAENIAVFIWDSMFSRLAKPQLLYEVKLWETDKNFVSYQGAKTEIRALDRRISENMCGKMSSDSE